MNVSDLRKQFGFLSEFSDQEVAKYILAAHGITDSRDPRYQPLESQLLGYDRTAGQIAKDTGLGAVQGVLGIGETAGILGGAAIPGVRAFDNPVVNTLRGFSDSLDQYKSPGLRNQELGAQVQGDIAVRDAAAEGAGAVGRIAAGARAQGLSYLQNPGLAVQDFASSAPSLVAGGFIGRGVQIGARAAGAGVGAAARAGVAGGVAGASALQGGDVAGDAYTRMREAGADYDTAAGEAAVAGAKGGAVALGLSAIPGATAIERSLIRGASGVGRGGVAGVARGFAGEFTQEAGEEGYGQYAGNQAVRTVDPSVDPYAGVGKAAVQGGVTAGPLGGFYGRRAREVVAPPAPRTETGEIDLTGQSQYGQYNTPAYMRRGLQADPFLYSPYQSTPEIQRQVSTEALARQPGMDGQGGIPSFLQTPEQAPGSVRSGRTLADVADQPVNPVQRTPASILDLYAAPEADPFDTTGFSADPGTQPGAGPSQAAPGALQSSPRTQAGATDFTTAPGAAPAQEGVDFTRERGPKGKPREVDTSGLELAPRGAPSMSQVIMALQAANTELGTKGVIRKDGQVAQTSGTGPLRQVLGAKDPLAKMREMYQDGKNPRDELLDVWHRHLTGKTIAEAKGEPATQTNSAGFVAEPQEQIKTQLQALREGRVKVVVLGKEEAAKADMKGLQATEVSDSSGATAIVVSRDGKAGQAATKRAKQVGLKQAMGEAKGVVDPTLTSQPTPPAEGAVAVQLVDQKTGHVIHEEVARPADVAKVKKVRGTTQRVVPIEQAMAERKARAADDTVSDEAKVQHVPAKGPKLAERKISARVDGAGAAMDGEGRRANPHKEGTPEHHEWLEGYEEVKAREEAAKPNPIAKKLIETVENTKDEQLYDESLFALYKLAATGDATAFNYFHENGYFNEKNDQGDPEKLKPAQRAEMAKLRGRWDAERGQERGRKFGASKYDKVAEGETPNIPRRSVLMGMAGLLLGGHANADTTLGRAKALAASVMNAKVPAAAEKLLRGNGATNIAGAKALKEALNAIATEGPAEVRALAKAIANLVPDSGLLLTVIDGDYNAHGAVELEPFPHMKLFNGEVSQGLRYSTVMHEALHVAVAARYRALSSGLLRSNDAKLGTAAPKAAPAMAQFRAVWDEFEQAATPALASAKGRLKTSLSEAIGDPDEFFVRSLTDPELQQWMAKQAYEGKTLLQRFIDWVKTSLLGFSKEGTTPSWLDAALLASDDLLKAMGGDPGDFARLRASNRLASKRDASKQDSVKSKVMAQFSQQFGEVAPAVAVRETQSALEQLRQLATDYRAMAQGAISRGRVETANSLLGTAQEHESKIESLQSALKVARAAEAMGEVAGQNAVKFDKIDEAAPVKPLADGARALTATLKAQVKGEELNESLLNMLTLRQIDEQYGHKLPALREWVSTVMERSSTGSKLAAEADRVALKWQQDVPTGEMKTLAEILLRASNAELQLDTTTPEYLRTLNDQERKEHQELRAKLEALSPAAKDARREALDVLKRQWTYTHSALKKFITLTVADPLLREQRLHDLDQEFGRNRGDYFPLSRFGDRVVIARGAAKDGRDVVTFHESPNSVDTEVRRLKDAGVKPDSIIVTMSTEYDPRKVPGTGFVRDLHQMIDNIASGEEAQQMHQTLQQLYLKSLPELSGAKHMIRRENVEGYSQDALRAFADAVTRGSRYASHLEFGPAVHAAMEAAEVQSRSSDRRDAAVVIGRKDGAEPVVKVVGTGTERLRTVEKMAEDGYAVEFFSAHPETVAEKLAAALEKATKEDIEALVQQVRDTVKKGSEGVEDLRAAKQLFNYMVRSQKADINPDPSKTIELAGQVGYAWFLGFSPAFWAMNTLQNPMVGIPHLGAKYGVAKTSKEWMRAAGWFAKVRIGKRLSKHSEPFSVEWLREQVTAGDLKGINKEELDMLQRLQDRQVLDFTQAMDLSRIGSASSSKWYKAMRLAAAGAHHTEVFNRVSFALAAYRLAMKSRSDMTHEEAVRAAEKDVASAHFDYSYTNKPLWMGKSSPAMRLVFMFQQYRQHMLYWWGNTIKDAVKGETPEARSTARKAALLMGTSQLLFAGTLGLPFIGALGTLVNVLAGGDDGEEPFNFERWLREAAVGMTGSEKAADVVLKGVFAAIGADISKRIGQADLLPLLNPGSARFERDFDDKTRAYLFDMLGPLGSIALGAARATEAFASGDYARGLAATLPKTAADIVRAYDQHTGGLKDKRGQQLAAEEAFDGLDTAFQALGITPTQVANAKQARGAVLDIQNALRDDTRRLTGSFIEAWVRHDAQGMTEALEGIRKYNATVAKGRLAQRELLITPDRLKSAIVERQRRAMLLALTGGLADTRQQLLIATRVSGLYDLEGRDANLDSHGLPALPTLSGGDGS
jgi:hypothetical protein